MKITVITVSYNAEKTIKKTINSILNQDYNDFEYIVVDGLSKDNTYNIVKEYDDLFRKKSIIYRHISEKDFGIFDAMNKAINMAQGEWVVFINADDSFYDTEVLKKVSYLLNSQYDVVYGKTNRIKKNKSYITDSYEPEIIYRFMPFCHQSCFTKTKLVKKYSFNTKYLVADYDLFLRMYIDGCKFKKTNLIISNYSMEGYSNQRKYQVYKSTLDVKHNLGLMNKNSFKRKIKNIYFYFYFKFK